MLSGRRESVNGEETRFAPTAWKRTHNVTKIPSGQQGQPAHFRARSRYGHKKHKGTRDDTRWGLDACFGLLGQREQLPLGVPNRVVAYVVMSQPGLCLCQSVAHFSAVSALLGGHHAFEQSSACKDDVFVAVSLAGFRRHVEFVSYMQRSRRAAHESLVNSHCNRAGNIGAFFS